MRIYIYIYIYIYIIAAITIEVGYNDLTIIMTKMRVQVRADQWTIS